MEIMPLESLDRITQVDQSSIVTHKNNAFRLLIIRYSFAISEFQLGN